MKKLRSSILIIFLACILFPCKNEAQASFCSIQREVKKADSHAAINEDDDEQDQEEKDRQDSRSQSIKEKEQKNSEKEADDEKTDRNDKEHDEDKNDSDREKDSDEDKNDKDREKDSDEDRNDNDREKGSDEDQSRIKEDDDDEDREESNHDDDDKELKKEDDQKKDDKEEDNRKEDDEDDKEEDNRKKDDEDRKKGEGREKEEDEDEKEDEDRKDSGRPPISSDGLERSPTRTGAVRTGGLDNTDSGQIIHAERPAYAENFYDVISKEADRHTDSFLISDNYNTVDPLLAAPTPSRVESVWVFEDELECFNAGEYAPRLLDPLLLSDDQFRAVNASAGDESIRFASLTAGDVVQTASFNGIYITKVPKDGNPDHEADIKTVCSYISSVFYDFDRHHPEVFWLSGKNKVRIITAKSSGTASTESYLFFLLADNEGFTLRAPGYEWQHEIEQGIRQRDEAVSQILALAGESRYSQISWLNLWLTGHNEYNTSADLYSIDNICHECLSALIGSTGTDGPVCDGYARAFKVLCDRLDIPCILVDGYAKIVPFWDGNAHMWNYVQMEDGQWYGVDVTWNDPYGAGNAGAVSGHENTNYLLVGAAAQMNGIPFSASHLPSLPLADGNETGSSWPALSLASYVPMG